MKGDGGERWGNWVKLTKSVEKDEKKWFFRFNSLRVLDRAENHLEQKVAPFLQVLDGDKIGAKNVLAVSEDWLNISDGWRYRDSGGTISAEEFGLVDDRVRPL